MVPGLWVLEVRSKYDANLLILQNYVGRLPLHYACTPKVPKEVIFKLLELYPAATDVKDEHGVLPSHLEAKLNLSPIRVKTAKNCLFWTFCPFLCPCYCYMGYLNVGFKFS